MSVRACFVAAALVPVVAWADETPDAQVMQVRAAKLLMAARSDYRPDSAEMTRLENEGIPGITRIVEKERAHLRPAVFAEILDFLVVGGETANEEVAGIALRMYLADPARYCREIARRSVEVRDDLLRQAQAGAELEGSTRAVQCQSWGKP